MSDTQLPALSVVEDDIRSLALSLSGPELHGSVRFGTLFVLT